MMNRRTLVIAGLLVLSVAFAFGEGANEPELSGQPDVVVSIEGMTCDLCPKAIRKSLLKVDGILEVVVSFQEEKAFLVLEGTVSDEAIEKAVERVGDYTVVKIERSQAS
jgi:mercuric ion binding protein